MLTIGDKFPSFDLKAVVSTDPKAAFKQMSDRSDGGKWKVVFFWPKDFTFVCPTEIAAFGKLNKAFNERDAVLYGVSTDSEFVHLAWRQNHADLKALPFPMLTDLKRELAQSLFFNPRQERGRSLAPTRSRGIIAVRSTTRGRPQSAGAACARRPANGLALPCNWQKGDDAHGGYRRNPC
jgi:peroxiredoxin (alkyl hydroperoxide reductase subunit C)